LTTITKTKLAFAIMGLIIFAAGVRFDDGRLRAVAIAFVAVAWILRFVRPRVPATDARPSDPPPEGPD
jgi:hypothetical protein